MKNTSWKTLVAGLLGAAGAYLKTIPDPAWLSGLGGLMESAGIALLGWFARDDDRTSEQVGAKK